MFEPKRAIATLAAQDFERAKSFYADKLGLKPAEEREGEARYEVGDSEFLIFPSSGAPSGTHTQMAFEVADLALTVKELRVNGVVFEEYDMPDFKTTDGIVELDGEKAAWFKDSEGNLVTVAERTN